MVTLAVLERDAGFRPLPFKRHHKTDAQTAKYWKKTRVLIITMCSYNVNFKLLPSKVFRKTEWQLFSATYYGVNRHPTAESNIDLLFASEVGFWPGEGKENLLQNLYCCVTTAFFILLDKVFNRFIIAEVKHWEKSSKAPQISDENLCSSNPFNVEGVIDSSWLSCTFAIPDYTRLFLWKILLKAC